jgi:hypothetical protein
LSSAVNCVSLAQTPRASARQENLAGAQAALHVQLGTAGAAWRFQGRVIPVVHDASSCAMVMTSASLQK